jgi:N-acetylglutamate synthase-like GNAT family acetyltransferase
MERNNYKTHIYFNPNYGLDSLEYVYVHLDEDEKEKIIEYVDDISRKITSDNIVDVIYTEEDDDDDEYLYEEASDIIVDKHQDLCGDIINRNYILQSFHKVHAVVIISDSLNILKGKIFGFALISFNEPYNSISIEVMCSNTKGVGKNLIGIIEKMCKSLLMPTIYLAAVESAIPFYKKMGFVKHKEWCKGMCAMIKRMRKGGKKGKTKKQKYQNENKKTRKNRL